MSAIVHQNLRFAATGKFDFALQIFFNINFLQSNPLPHITADQFLQFPVAAGKSPAPSAFAAAGAAIFEPPPDLGWCEYLALQAYFLLF